MPPYKPLPLKQRTSSVDHRRDYSHLTITSLLGLLKVREFLVTVDHFSIWRRHLAWAIEDGKELREYMTKRYASSMVFCSLLLSAELGVLFNSSQVTTQVREALRAEATTSLLFWVGIFIIFSVILTILALISTFTAWTMVSAVHEANAHCVFRSSIGQYAAELPGRFIVSSIYAFLVWVIMFFFILMPFGIYSTLLLIAAAALFVHTITAFSSFGRVIMHSGAMGSQRIFDPQYEENLSPHMLHQNLLSKAQANLTNHMSIRRQYRNRVTPLRRHYSPDELSAKLSELSSPTAPPPPPPSAPPQRKRTESLVKFADGLDTFEKPVPLPNTVHVRQNSIGTPMSNVTMDNLPSSKMGRPPLRSSNGSNRHFRDWSFGSSLADPSPTQAMHKTLANVDNSAIFAKWLSSENGGGDQLSTVADISVDGSAGSGAFPPSRPLRSSLQTLSERSTNSAPSDSELSVPGQVGGPRSFSAVSALDDMDKEGLTDDERFDREYGALFEPYNDDDDDDPNNNKDTTTVNAHLLASSERESLLERGEHKPRNNYRTLTGDSKE